MNPTDSSPNDEMPLPPRTGCQFGIARLLILMVSVALVLGLVVRMKFPIQAEILLGGYLLMLTTYAFLRGPYLFHEIRRLTKIRRQFDQRRERTATELEKIKRRR